MSEDTNNKQEPFFGGSLHFLNHIGHNYFLCVLLVTGSFALGVMGNYIGIGAALGTGIGYGLVQRKKNGFVRGFLIGTALVSVVLIFA